MTTPPSQQPLSDTVALALSEMGRKLDVGFTRLDGQMALIIQRHDQSDQKIAALETKFTELARNVDTLERGETERQKRNDSRVTDLEKSRWPERSVMLVLTLIGVAVAAYASYHGG